MIQIEFIGILQDKTSICQSEIKLNEPITIRTLLQRIISDFPKANDLLLDSESAPLKQKILVFVNGKEINVLNGLETMLKEGDEIVFVPIIHGG